MPWWGWVLIVLTVIMVPIKFRMLQNLFKKNRD
jgi:hypothetical protein